MSLALRLALARGLAWAWLIAGWIALAALAERLTAGPVEAAGVVAAWLLVAGGAADALGRVRWPSWAWRAALVLAAGLAAWAAVSATRGAGLPALVGLALAWGLGLTLASGTVRALRLSRPAPLRTASPIGAATAGAVLAWATVGDPTDLPAMAERVAIFGVLAAMLLAALRPGPGVGRSAPARPGCRAGLFDCSMPAWPIGAWRDPAHWPVGLAALVMLPMMWGLPQMLALCRSAAVPASLVLALHLAAMFLPAVLWAASGGRGLAPTRLAATCAVLLGAGAVAAWAGGPTAGWGLALAHGAAWSLAWAARLSAPAVAAPTGPMPAPWRAAAGSALVVGGLGVAQALAGPAALLAVQALVGGLAALAWCVALARRPSPHPPRCKILRCPSPPR